MSTIVTPQQFLRQAGKLFRTHPELKSRFAKVLAELQTDPFLHHLELLPRNPRSVLRNSCFALYVITG